MNIQVNKWGNSLAIRIPHKVAEALNLSEGTEAEISLSNGEMILAPKNKKYNLHKLLSQINKNNLHEKEEFGIVGEELI